MAESYFLYYEELDWGARICKAGYQLWYVHNSMILHKESISTGKMSPFKTYYMNRSRLLYLRRNVSGFRFIIALVFQLLVSIPKNLSSYLLKGEFDHLKAYHKALKWHLSHLLYPEIHLHPTLH